MLRWWYMVGTFILLAGVIGLVTWQWGRVGRYFVFFLALAATAGLYALAHFLSKRVKLGSSMVFAIASVLVPLDLYVFNQYAIAGRSFDLDLLGIAGAVLAAAVYGVNYYRTRDRALLAFLSLTPLALLFFVLRASGASMHYYGLWFVGLAAGYFGAGLLIRRQGAAGDARTMYAVGNVTIALALLTTVGDYRYFFGAGFRTTGALVAAAAAALLVGSQVYEDRVLAYVSSAMVMASAFFLGHAPGAAWYASAPAMVAAAGVLLALGLMEERVMHRGEGRSFVNAGLLALLAVLAATAGKDVLFHLPKVWQAATDTEIRASLITGAAAAALLWTAALLEDRKYLGYVASAAVVYASLVALAGRVHGLPVWCLVEATAVAGALMVMGVVLDRTRGSDWALSAYIPAFTVAGVSTVASAVLYLPAMSRQMIPALALHPHAYLAVTVSALATTCYLAVAAALTRRPYWLYAACATVTLAFAVQAHAASGWLWVRHLSGGGINYGMLLLPVVLLFAASGYVLRRLGQDELSWPPLIAFAGVAAFSFGSQFYYLFTGSSAAAAITCGTFAALGVAGALALKRGALLYPAALAAFMTGIEVLNLTLTRTGIEMNHALLLTPLAAALLLAGVVLLHRGNREFGMPMLVSSGAFVGVGLVAQTVLAAHGMVLSVYLYLFAWALVSAVAAVLASRTPGRGRMALLPELLAGVSIAQLAMGTAFTVYAYGHDYAAVSLCLASLGAVLATAFASASEGAATRWLRRPLSIGAVAVGAAAVAFSLASPHWSDFRATVISVTLLSLTFVLQGLVTGERLYDRMALAVFGAGTLGGFLYYAASTGWFATDQALIWQCGSLALMAALHLASSLRFDDVLDHCAAHLFAVLAWVRLGAVLHVFPAQTGYWLLGPAVLVSVTAFAAYSRGYDGLAMVGWCSTAMLFAAAIALPMSLALTGQTIVCMSVAVALAGASVAAYGREELLYLPLALAVGEAVYILAVNRQTVAPSLGGLLMMGPAVLFLAAGWALSLFRRGKAANALLQFTAAAAALGTAYSLFGLFAQGQRDVFVVAALFTAGAVYACIAIIKGYLWLGHVSFANFFAGYALMLANGRVANPHLYLLPMGVYLIYYCERLGYGTRVVRLLHLVGFTTLALSSFIPSLTEQGGFQAIVLLGESVAAIAVGVWQRRRVFLGAGLAFIAVDGVVRLWSPAASLHWSIYAVLVGAMVIITGILLETRRELLLEKGAAMVRQLKLWK